MMIRAPKPTPFGMSLSKPRPSSGVRKEGQPFDKLRANGGARVEVAPSGGSSAKGHWQLSTGLLPHTVRAELVEALPFFGRMT
jgi:hypothetical protein